jgi:hypothetical protein
VVTETFLTETETSLCSGQFRGQKGNRFARDNLGVKKVSVTAKSPSKMVNYVVFQLNLN